jgi:hypothetical protein
MVLERSGFDVRDTVKGMVPDRICVVKIGVIEIR